LISSFLLWFAFLGLIARPANAQTLSAAPGQIASLRYSLTVDADTLKINSLVTYTIRIENTPGSANQLDSVVAFFKIPQLSNRKLLLKPASFNLMPGDPQPAGFPNNVVDLITGLIRWDFVSISRGAPVIIRFSFALEDIAAISLQSCGENYVTATLDVEALDRGVRVRPGPRSVESILDVRPDMELGPISGDRAAQRGRIVSYIIRYSNVGNVGDNATVCIKLPLGADAQNVRTVPDTIKKRMVTADSLCFDVGLVPADSLVKTFVVRVPLMASIPSQVDSVCISVLIAALCDTSEFNNGPRDRCIPLDPLDLLSLTKLATPAVVTVGDTVSYTIRYANLDSILTAYNLRVVDVLPSGTQFITADAPFQFFNNQISWSLDSLAARSSRELHYSVRVPLDFYRNQPNTVACQGTFISNFAEITSTGPGGAPSPESSVKLDNNRAFRSVFVRPLGDLLALTVTVDTARVNPAAAALMPGDTLTYNLRFRNNSVRLTATNAILADTLPAPQIATLLTPSRLAGFVYEPASNRLVRRNLVLAPGQTGSVSFRVMIRTDVATCTAQNLFNRAGIRDSLEFDCDLTNNADRDTLRMPSTGDLLAVVLSAARRVIVDTLGQVSFTLDYRNTGTIAALNVVVADTLPPELEFVSSAPAPSRSPGGNIFFWDIGTLARSDSGKILINARVRRNVFTCDSLALRSRAGISSSPADCNVGNNAAATAVMLRTDPAQQPQLVMMQPTPADFQDQNNDGCAEPGEMITMRLQVRNMSLIAATRIDTVKMRAMLGMIQNFRFAPATLAPGAVGTATFQIRAGESDRVDSLALAGQITAAGFCPRPLSGKYCFKPRARLEFTAPVSINDRDGNRNGCADDNGGEPLNVVVRYQNLSAIAADSVDLKVVVTPPGFALLGSNRNATRSGAAGDTFRIRVSLAPGQIDSLILKISYADFDAQQVMVTTTATLRVSTVAAPVVQSAAILVCRECYARPNPFIPSRHIDPAMNMDGVRFAPNDGQNVDIFDLQGNRVRRLKTNERWNGRDGGGKDCPAGVYLWVIEGHCRGTIVVVR
jgi:uncharacterized repeat protein (TIGR01451 family)